MRSPSPSNAIPSSAPERRTAAWRSRRFSSTVGSGWWFGKRPSDSQNSGTMSAPSCRRVSVASRLVTPLPQSTTAFTRLLATETRSEEHTSELQSLTNLVCRLLLEKKKKEKTRIHYYRLSLQ